MDGQLCVGIHCYITRAGLSRPFEHAALTISLQISNQTQGVGVLSGRGGFEGSDRRSYKPNIVWGMQAVLELC